MAVEGCDVHYLRWGERFLPGLVLIHGGAAHAHWWSFLAPLLTRGFHVVALDLSGHGDSGWRQSYDHEQWAREVLAVADDAQIVGKPILVGHSMGGFVSMVVASRSGDQLAGAIIVDAPVRRPDPESEEGARGRAFRNPKVYASADEAMAHFRLVPSQPSEHAWIIEHVARHSLRRVGGNGGSDGGGSGWTWKFDPAVFRRFAPPVFHDYLADVRCRVAVLSGEFSDLVTPEVADYMSELLGRTAPFVEIPQAYHHLLLDQPLAFVAALRALLADWEHSVPSAGAVGSRPGPRVTHPPGVPESRG